MIRWRGCHEHDLYGTEVCAVWHEYVRTREWVLSRMPAWSADPALVVQMVQWVMSIAYGDAAAGEWYAG